LRSDFRQLAEAVSEAGMIVAVTTNATEMARKPESMDAVDELVLSLDSLDERTNDALRGQGSLRSVMNVLDHAGSRRIKVIINMVVTKTNVHEVDEMQAFCEESGFVFHAQPVVFGRIAYNEKARDVQLSQAEIHHLHTQLAGYLDQGKKMLFSRQTYLRVLEWQDFDLLNRTGIRLSRCFAGRHYAHIEPDGSLFPCNLQVGSFHALNCADHGFENALIHARSHFCQDCWHPYYNERKALFGLNLQAVRTALLR